MRLVIIFLFTSLALHAQTASIMGALDATETLNGSIKLQIAFDKKHFESGMRVGVRTPLLAFEQDCQCVEKTICDFDVFLTVKLWHFRAYLEDAKIGLGFEYPIKNDFINFGYFRSWDNTEMARVALIKRL